MEQLGEPLSETNRLGKLCAECQAEHAAFFCGRCHCTPYCSHACAKAHWGRAHKRACAPNAPWHLSPPQPLLPGSLCAYTEAELSSMHSWFLLRPGSLPNPPLDERDGARQLIEPFSLCPFGGALPWSTSPACGDALTAVSAGLATANGSANVGMSAVPALPWDSTECQPAPVTAEVCAMLGWARDRVVCSPCLGYGKEDAAVLIVLSDQSLALPRPEGAEQAGGEAGHPFRSVRNNVASSFVHLPVHRGAFLVGKVRRCFHNAALAPASALAGTSGAPAKFDNSVLGSGSSGIGMGTADSPASLAGAATGCACSSGSDGARVDGIEPAAQAFCVREEGMRMSKAELVDLVVWRRHLGSTKAQHTASEAQLQLRRQPPRAAGRSSEGNDGSSGRGEIGAGGDGRETAAGAPAAAVEYNIGHSTRMHRENMRRRELAGVLRSTNFQNLFL